nr:CMF_HP1_G0006710.mRNA.1.CDS.1 [Saccharomyces cerevisiae]
MNHDYIVLGKYILSEKKNLALNNVNKTVDIAVKRLVAGFKLSFGREISSYTKEFLLDVQSRVNFTYRTRFVPIARAPDGPSPLSLNLLQILIALTLILGGGVWIRTGQSLLGNALQILHLGRDFRVNGNESLERESKFVNWFNDTPEAPFSLHNFVSAGTELSDKRPGEWFGPAATARSIQSLIYGFPNVASMIV